MGNPANRSRFRRSTIAGFSTVELAVSLCVMMTLTGIAIPSLMRSLRAYQLNDAAARVSDMLKFTRYEAVRRNKQINFLTQANGTGWIVGTDSNGNGAIDPAEKQQQIFGFITLLPTGNPVPAATAITAALGTLTPLSGANNSVTFDARGAIRNSINGPLSSKVYVFYIGSSDPDPGFRAVVLLPSGSTQIWSAPSAGPWHQVS